MIFDASNMTRLLRKKLEAREKKKTRKKNSRTNDRRDLYWH